MVIDQVYIISIDHRPEYIQELIDRANKIPLPYGTPVKVIEGFVGKRLMEENGQEYTLYKNWKLPESVHQYGYWNRPTTYGEAGGMISHTLCWEDAYENGHKTILIMEDDFLPIVDVDWTIFDETQEYEWEMCLMAHNSLHRVFPIIGNPIRIGLKHFVKPTYFYNTHCYLLKESAIKKLVELHLPTLKKNVVVSDEFFAAVMATHPRKDMRAMYISNIAAIATKEDYVTQTRFQDAGNSLTEPTEEDLVRERELESKLSATTESNTVVDSRREKG